MQVELLDRRRWKTRVELANAIFEYLESLNPEHTRVSAESRADHGAGHGAMVAMLAHPSEHQRKAMLRDRFGNFAGQEPEVREAARG